MIAEFGQHGEGATEGKLIECQNLQRWLQIQTLCLKSTWTLAWCENLTDNCLVPERPWEAVHKAIVFMCSSRMTCFSSAEVELLETRSKQTTEAAL